MGYKLSHANLVLIARVAHKLSTFCVILVLMACVSHEPWTFLWDFCSTLHLSPMGYDISRENLVLIACVAHDLWAFGVILVRIVCVAHGLLTFCSSNRMCRPLAMNFLCDLVRIPCPAHELCTFLWGSSSTRICRPWVMNFSREFSSTRMYRPWTMNFLWDFSSLSHESPMSYKTSLGMLVLNFSQMGCPWANNFY